MFVVVEDESAVGTRRGAGTSVRVGASAEAGARTLLCAWRRTAQAGTAGGRAHRLRAQV